MPSVTGPVSCSLIGARRPATAPRKARSPTNGSPSIPAVVSGARGSSIGSSSSSEPSGSTRTPSMPQAAWAIIRSMPDRFGSDGAAAGAAGARARRSRPRAGRCAAGSRWSWPPRAEGRRPSPPFVLPSHASPWLVHRENGQPSSRVGKSQRPMAFLAGPWPARITWGLLPLLLGPALGDALGEHSLAVARTASGLAWVTWAGVLVAVVLPTTVSLTALRIATPAALGVGELGRHHRRARAWPGRWRSAAPRSRVVAAFSPLTGDVFIDGSGYGDERRFALRVPTALLFGPVPLAGIGAVAAPIAGPLLLAAEQWVAGARRAGGRGPGRGGRRSERCTGSPAGGSCFVPAGLVLHDPHSLRGAGAVPPRGSIDGSGPADGRRRPGAPGPHAGRPRAGPGARAGGAGGDLAPALRSHGAGGVGDPAAFTPTRPGALLAAASARRTACPLRRAPLLAPAPGCGAGSSRSMWWGGGVETAVEAAAEPTAPTPRVRRRRLAVLVVAALVAMGVVVVATDQVSQPEPEPLGPAAGSVDAWCPTAGSAHGSTCTTGPLELGRPGAVGGRRRRGRHGRGRRADALHPDRPHALGHARRDGAGAPRSDHPARPQQPDARGGVVPAHLRGRRRRPAPRSPSRPPSTSAGWPSTSSRPRSPTSPSATAACSTSRRASAPRSDRTRRWPRSRRRPCTSRW